MKHILILWKISLFLFLAFFLFFYSLDKTSAASSINSVSIQGSHNIYDICMTPPPHAEEWLLSAVFINPSVFNDGSEGFNEYLKYISWQSGDPLTLPLANPQTAQDYGAGGVWWKFPNGTLGFGSYAWVYGNPGLPSGTRTIRVVLYNSSMGISGPYMDTPFLIDRTAPNYTGNWPAGSCSPAYPNAAFCSPKLRLTTPSSSSPYDPAGIRGMSITLEPRTPREDFGGFGFDRADLWINWNGADSGVSSACAPAPPYDAFFGNLCGAMNCANFVPGSGRAWYMGAAYGVSGGTVNWNTNGFATGTRTIVSNAFDRGNPYGAGQNVMTYTGNGGGGQYFARVDYNLMPPHAPTAAFSSTALIQANPGENKPLPTATATDSYGYLTQEQIWAANQSRTASFNCPSGVWAGPWCAVINPQAVFTKRSSYAINTSWQVPNNPGLYDIVINAYDQFGEKCTGDPQAITYAPQWPPLWTSCGPQSRLQINVGVPNSIIGTVYIDSNGDGLINDGGLTYSSGASINTSGLGLRTTNGSGYYSYASVVDGNYSVTLSGIANYKITYPCTGLAGGASCTAPVVNASGGNTYIRDFAITPVYTITGNVFVDNDGDGVKDAGESGYNSNGVSIVSIASIGVASATNVNGDYTLTSVPAGTYPVSLSVPLNYYATTANPLSVTVGPNQTGRNFGIAPPRTISGRVFRDVNKDGLYNAGDTNYAGSITITSSGGTITYPAQGSYSISGLTAPGPYTVSYTSLPADYQMTYPLNGPPPSYSGIIVGPTCASDPGGHWSCSSGNVTELNFGISNLIPWFQGKGADMRSDVGFSNEIPSGANCTSVASLEGAGSTPGIVFSGDSDADFGSGQASRNPYNWIVGGSQPPGYKELFVPFRSGVVRTSYSYMLTTASQNGITPIDLSTVCTLSSCSLPLNLPNGAYKANGDLTLMGLGAPSSYTFPANKNYVFLVNGDLNINTRLIVPAGSTVTFSAAQDIIIDKNVEGVSPSTDDSTTNINGLFSADRNFILQGNGAAGCSPGATKDKRLNIGGSVVVNAGFLNGSFISERDICAEGAECPSYSFIERPDFILNAPEFIKHPNFLWQEVAP